MSETAVRARLVERMVVARVRGRPHTLSHLVTARCNGRCPTCLWRDPARPELDTATVAWLYDQAGRAGFAQLVVWGGEPLLRKDLPQLLRAARRAGLLVTLITNGWYLRARWHELRGSVDALIVSLDDVGPAHDRLRGLPGLYERLESAAAGLERDPLRPALLVNTVLSRGNSGALSRVAEVARRWGAGLYFCPMETGELESTGLAGPAGRRLPPDGGAARGGAAGRGAGDGGGPAERLATAGGTLGGLALPPDELRAAAREARALKDRGYPVLATRAWLDLLERDPALVSYRCRGPHSVVTVMAGGAVRDCRRRDRPLADVRALRATGRPLSDVFSLPRRRELLREAGSCTVCNNPDVIELSWLWDLRPAMLRKVLELAAR